MCDMEVTGTYGYKSRQDLYRNKIFVTIWISESRLRGQKFPKNLKKWQNWSWRSPCKYCNSTEVSLWHVPARLASGTSVLARPTNMEPDHLRHLRASHISPKALECLWDWGLDGNKSEIQYEEHPRNWKENAHETETKTHGAKVMGNRQWIVGPSINVSPASHLKGGRSLS